MGDCGEVELNHFDTYDGARCSRECETTVTLDTCSCLAPHMPNHKGNIYQTVNFVEFVWGRKNGEATINGNTCFVS